MSSLPPPSPARASQSRGEGAAMIWAEEAGTMLAYAASIWARAAAAVSTDARALSVDAAALSAVAAALSADAATLSMEATIVGALKKRLHVPIFVIR